MVSFMPQRQPKSKLQHWCGFAAILACEAAPVLEFG